MPTAKHPCRYVMLIVAVAAVSLTALGPSTGAAADETKDDTQPSGAAKTDSKAGDTGKTRKASCRCGKLSVTYEGPDPERITLCHCKSCQLRTGTAFSIQARFPRSKVKIVGKSTKWTVPTDKKKPVCDNVGATYHFCPVCGTTVYWDIAPAPELIGIAIGTFFDPTFPPPKISGYEKFGHPWSMKAAELPLQRLELAEPK